MGKKSKRTIFLLCLHPMSLSSEEMTNTFIISNDISFGALTEIQFRLNNTQNVLE